MKMRRACPWLFVCLALSVVGVLPSAFGDGDAPANSATSILEWIKSGGKKRKPSGRAAWTEAERIARAAYEVIERKCFECHGQKEPKANLDVRTVDALLIGGDSGPAVVRGDSRASGLLERIQADEMPPRELRYKLSIKPVSKSELVTLYRWIDGGLVEPPRLPTDVGEDTVSEKDRDWWSFRPPQRPPVPEVADSARIRTPIDAFLLHKLRAAGLTFSPEADRATLVRRLYLHVTGLPPTPFEVESFLRDEEPDSYGWLVDSLLASPRYGEHWGRYWLDAAGYADSEGALSSDPVNDEFYRYRDYVVRSINSDKPYDRFLVEQLAGDELVDHEKASRITPEIRDNLIATGFLRCGVDATRSPETNFLVDRYKVIVNTIDNIGSALLGMTLQCAQCHSHKYDPIAHRDYYRFGAIFAAAYSPREWVKPPDRYIPLATKTELTVVAEHNAGVERELGPLTKELAALNAEFKKRLIDEKLKRVPKSLVDTVREAVETPEEKRSVAQDDLVAEYGLHKLAQEVSQRAAFKEAAKPLREAIAKVQAKRKKVDRAFGLRDMGADVLPFHLLRRGNPLRRIHEVRPDVPAVLKPVVTSENLSPRLKIQPPWPGAQSTGRRLAFARWLTRSDHPLTARVIVNRIWRRYFGTGIVSSLDNFGNMGALPTHPELLDWLAVEFVDGGWSFKRLHRLFLLSTAFRQTSRVIDIGIANDPMNKLLWRMPLKRLDAEPLRDAILQATGLLDPRMYGKPGAIARRDDGQVYTEEETGTNFRRSVYMLRRRTQPLTLLDTFDAPPPWRSCTERRTSIVVSQALLLENSEFMEKMAETLAQRAESEAVGDVRKRIELVYRLVLSRAPTTAEGRAAREFLKAQAGAYGPDGSTEAEHSSLVDFCLTLLNTAEFIYVD